MAAWVAGSTEETGPVLADEPREALCAAATTGGGRLQAVAINRNERKVVRNNGISTWVSATPRGPFTPHSETAPLSTQIDLG